ncbi:hypothetical protein PF006_g1158 [Phytophthora fragariae]|uniref:NYN domain-containing protein n=1 Tax=Phytophthora fragariae TaxID=53985 RepID=A0A6A3V5R9_9STRA|nr:hypothetical protein PF006_g1158 [Phytophthora fragariae]
MKILSVFAALHALATPAHAKSNSSVSSLEELWMFIAVVYAAVLVPLLGYFLYSLVSDPATGQYRVQRRLQRPRKRDDPTLGWKALAASSGMTKKRKERSKSTALIIDGAYARIQGQVLSGKLDFASLRTELEYLVGTQFEECWYFDSQRFDARGNSPLAAEYHALKYARPYGPQFQVKVLSTKKYNCRCTNCGHRFTQNVQKGVDNAIATKLLTLTTQNDMDRVVLFSGDGDFYTSLRYVRSALRKEIWVVGYWGTISWDLQQLSTGIIWINDIWGRVKHQARRSGGGRPLSRGNRYSATRSTRQPHRRSQRDYHSRRSHQWRERYEISEDRHGPYRPARLHSRELSPQREFTPARTHRLDSPFQGDGAECEEVNLSGSEDEDTVNSSPRGEEDASCTGAEGQVKIRPTQFPLPMAVPVMVTPSPISTADNNARSRPLFEWAFGEGA